MESNYILDHVGVPAVLENLAEEAAELAQASLKLARYLRQENPIRVKNACEVEMLHRNLIEEYTDVANIACVINLQIDKEVARVKFDRWLTAIMDKESDDSEHVVDKDVR